MVARRRYQTGCLFKRGKRRKVWVARWREDVLLEGGQLGRLHRSVVFGTVADLPTKRHTLTKLEEQLRPVNQGTGRPEASMRFGAFVELQWSALVLPTLKLSTLLSGILETAVEYGYLTMNPARGVRFPQQAEREAPTIIAGDDFAKLSNEVDEPYKTMVELIAAAGLRIGELLAVRWRALDLEVGTLAVR